MKKKSIAIIAILCIMSMLIAFGACQKGGDEDTPSGQPSGNAPSGSVDSGEIPSGSIDSGDIDSGDTVPSGSVDSGDAPSGDQQPELPSGSISSGDIGSGENPPEEEKPKQPITNAEIISAFETYCQEGMINRCFLGMDINIDNISNEEWFLIKNEDEKIASAEYSCIYQSTSSNSYYARGKVVFENAISEEELSNGSTGKMTYTRIYRTNFNPTIQTDRGALTKAICDKVFGENASATRYIVDNGQQVDNTLGMQAREFKVVEITDTGIQEISIRIKYSSNNDEDYIANLENQSNYRTFSEKSYTLSGNKISQ